VLQQTHREAGCRLLPALRIDAENVESNFTSLPSHDNFADDTSARGVKLACSFTLLYLEPYLVVTQTEDALRIRRCRLADDDALQVAARLAVKRRYGVQIPPKVHRGGLRKQNRDPFKPCRLTDHCTVVLRCLAMSGAGTTAPAGHSKRCHLLDDCGSAWSDFVS